MSLKDEVERLAHLCNTPSPEKIKQQLVRNHNGGTSANLHNALSTKKLSPAPLRTTDQSKKKNGADRALERKLEKYNKPRVSEQEVTPGFIVKKSPAKVEVTLTDDFWKREEYYKRLAEEEERRNAPDQRDAIIEYLQDQLQQMALQYENEKIQYKHSLNKVSYTNTNLSLET